MNIRDIKLNEKYTIIANDSSIIGSAMCTVIKCTIKDIQLVQYAQYKAAIQIRYREQRKRKDQILTIINERIAILKGYHDIDKSIIKPIDDTLQGREANNPENYFNHKDLIFKKDKREVESYEGYGSIVDITFNYLADKRFNEGLRGAEAKDEGYFKLLKDTLINLNFSICDDMFNYFKADGCEGLIDDVKQVRFTLYDI